MFRAFLEDEDNIQLLYATIDSLKLNPEFISDDPLYEDYCILERITNGRTNEMYSQLGIEWSQREIEHYKKVINYDAVVEEINQDMKRLGLKK